MTFIPTLFLSWISMWQGHLNTVLAAVVSIWADLCTLTHFFCILAVTTELKQCYFEEPLVIIHLKHNEGDMRMSVWLMTLFPCFPFICSCCSQEDLVFARQALFWHCYVSSSVEPNTAAPNSSWWWSCDIYQCPNLMIFIFFRVFRC